MKKVIMLLVVLFLVGCSGGNGDDETNGSLNDNDTNGNVEGQEEDQGENEVSEDGLEAIVSYFESEGFEVGSKETKAYEMVGAVEGFGIEVNGSQIELYLYETESPDLEEIRTEGEYDMDGFTLPAEYNGNIVLMGHDDHPEADEIVENFIDY